MPGPGSLLADYDAIKQYLLAIELPPEDREAHRIWVDLSLPRFLRTLDLVPAPGTGQRCLEIGSAPYSFTLLMKRFRAYDLALTNYATGGTCPDKQLLRLPAYGENHHLASISCDIEHEPLPFPDRTFDGVLCCELLEHVTADPVAMLSEIHRVLKPQGWLVLTTPNVACLENVLHLVHGRNVYHPYERIYGPTWRHNREYTPDEVVALLSSVGFEIEVLWVEDAHPPGFRPPWSQRFLRWLLNRLYQVCYGNQIYLRARRGQTFRKQYPSWLFTGDDRAAAVAGAKLPPAMSRADSRRGSCFGWGRS